MQNQNDMQFDRIISESNFQAFDGETMQYSLLWRWIINAWEILSKILREKIRLQSLIKSKDFD